MLASMIKKSPFSSIAEHILTCELATVRWAQLMARVSRVHTMLLKGWLLIREADVSDFGWLRSLSPVF